MKKGISAVIAVILLLAITISMIGFTFFWFSRVTELSANSTEQQLTQQQRRLQLGISLLSVTENGDGTLHVTFRNKGTVAINPNELALVVENNDDVGLSPAPETYASSVEPGEVVIWDTDKIACTIGTPTLTITADLNVVKDVISYTCE